MSDLEHLYRRLVDSLITLDPARLHRPLLLAELTQSVLPYRAHRRALGVDSAEDYDLLLLRLCAGEGGYVTLEPEAVQIRFQAELAAANPDLSLLQEFPGAELHLSTERLAYALGPGPEAAYAPPDPEDVPEFDPPPSRQLPTGQVPWTVDAPEPPSTIIPLREGAPSRERDGVHRCGYCGGALPTGRQINFCPHCGQSQSFVRCPECGSEVELGWHHCINCGHPVGDEG
ncbi:MAG: zinc ribbon domain-containing protein [Gemmatimonadales bacterium]